MSVKVRTKEISNGRLSIYLDFFPPIKGKDGKPTRREFLKRYNLKNPINADEKLLNRENLLFADSVRLMREREILNEQDGLYNSRHKKSNFIEYFEKMILQRKQNNSNFNNWRSALRYLKDFTGGYCNMVDINEEFCKNFKNYLMNSKQLNYSAKPLSLNSAVSYFNKFRCAVNEAFEERLLTHNVLAHVTGIKPQESKREFLTQEELQKLANTTVDIGILKNAALFSALTGLRWSDIYNLKWSDIQKTENRYFLHIIQQKTNHVMNHPISNKAFSLLGEAGLNHEKIFKNLKYSEKNNFRLKEWILSAGITKKITFHCFRHTYATLLLNKGVGIYTVSKMLGHKNIQTSTIYTKIMTETKIEAANIIDIDL